MNKVLKVIIKLLIILLWVALFYLQFERPYISSLAQNLSPTLLPSVFLHNFFWLAWLAFPLLVLAFLKGRFFCWNICPLGLLQDLLPSGADTRIRRTNRLIFLFLFGFAFFSLNLLAFFDPLVTLNRTVASMKIRFAAAIVFLAPLILILLLSLIRRRWWCFKLCPLGALFDWIFRLKSSLREKGTPVDTGRRKALIVLGSGLLGGWLWRRFNLRKSELHRRLIRPPGAINENDFTDRCIRCGSCISVCLTGGLQPALLEGGIEGLFTPRLVPEIGECDEFCNKCGQACPTQAIRYLPLEEKRNFKMGTARVDRNLCIAWDRDRLCLVCQEYCPYLAIRTVKNENGTPCPVVIEELCRGCGLCEKNCFAHPIHAIMVYNRGAGRFID